MTGSDNDSSAIIRSPLTRRSRSSTRLLSTPPAITENLHRRTLLSNWRARGSVERLKGLVSPLVTAPKSLKSRSQSTCRIVPDGPIMVEPISTVSSQHATIDPEQKTVRITYRVFFCSSTSKIEKVEERMELLNKTDLCSEANYQEEDAGLIETTTFRVLISRQHGVICVERDSTYMICDEPEFSYEFKDDRSKTVCLAAFIPNSYDSINAVQSPLTVHSSYQSIKDPRNKFFFIEEKIELKFGKHDQSNVVDKEVLERSKFKTDRMELPIYFDEQINAYRENKLEVVRLVAFACPDELKLLYERTWFNRTRLVGLVLEENEELDESTLTASKFSRKRGSLQSTFEHIVPRDLGPIFDQASGNFMDWDNFEETTANETLNTKGENDNTPLSLRTTSDWSNNPNANSLEWNNFKETTLNDPSKTKDENGNTPVSARTSDLSNMPDVYNSMEWNNFEAEPSNKSREIKDENENRHERTDALSDNTTNSKTDTSSSSNPVETTNKNTDLIDNQDTSDSSKIAEAPTPAFIQPEKPDTSNSLDLTEKNTSQKLSINAEKTFDLTKNQTKQIYHHNKNLRFGAIVDGKNSIAVNLKIVIRSNKPAVEFKPVLLQVDGVKIWQNPENDSNNDN